MNQKAIRHVHNYIPQKFFKPTKASEIKTAKSFHSSKQKYLEEVEWEAKQFQLRKFHFFESWVLGMIYKYLLSTMFMKMFWKFRLKWKILFVLLRKVVIILCCEFLIILLWWTNSDQMKTSNQISEWISHQIIEPFHNMSGSWIVERKENLTIFLSILLWTNI